MCDTIASLNVGKCIIFNFSKIVWVKEPYMIDSLSFINNQKKIFTKKIIFNQLISFNGLNCKNK